MSALQGLQFHPYEVDPEEHGIQAVHPEHGVIGSLTWHTPTNAVESLRTHTTFQRQGVATAMWHAAKERNPNLSHSQFRSDSGDAWARSVTPDLPERHPHSAFLP